MQKYKAAYEKTKQLLVRERIKNADLLAKS